jgi:hypothetical protein
LRQAANYDALGIRRYERLYAEHFGAGGNWMLARRASTRGLKLFGLGAVLDHDGWLEVDTAFGFVEPAPKALFRAGELVSGTQIVQELTGVRDGLDSLRLRFDRPPEPLACVIDVVLEDAQSGAVVAQARFDAATLDDSEQDEVAATLRFAPLEGSRTRVLRLRISSPDGAPGRAYVPRARTDWEDRVRQAVASGGAQDEVEELVGRWRLVRDGERLPAQLWLDLGFAAHEFRDEARVGRFTLWEGIKSKED